MKVTCNKAGEPAGVTTDDTGWKGLQESGQTLLFLAAIALGVYPLIYGEPNAIGLLGLGLLLGVVGAIYLLCARHYAQKPLVQGRSQDIDAVIELLESAQHHGIALPPLPNADINALSCREASEWACRVNRELRKYHGDKRAEKIAALSGHQGVAAHD